MYLAPSGGGLLSARLSPLPKEPGVAVRHPMPHRSPESVFFDKLDEAIAHQQSLVCESKRRVEQGQQEWVDQRNRVKAFDTLSHRHQTQQARKEAKQEQRLTDEHAAKQFRDRTGEE